jgi:hypothetical protein
MQTHSPTMLVCVERIQNNSWEILPHLPYSPDLIPCSRKDQMWGQHYATNKTVQEAFCLCLQTTEM